MWLRSHSTMKRRGRTEVAGENKAVFELADAMRHQMSEHTGEEGDGASPITEETLHRRITKDLRGGSIAYTTVLLANADAVEKWTLKACIKSNKATTFVIFFFALYEALVFFLFIYNFFVFIHVMFCSALPVTYWVALYIGSTRRSRTVIFFWSLIAFGVLSVAIILPLVATNQEWLYGGYFYSYP